MLVIKYRIHIFLKFIFLQIWIFSSVLLLTLLFTLLFTVCNTFLFIMSIYFIHIYTRTCTRTYTDSLELDCFSRRINSRSIGARRARRWLRRRPCNQRASILGRVGPGRILESLSRPRAALRLFMVPKGVKGRWALLRLGSSPRCVSSTRHLRTAYPPPSLSRERVIHSFGYDERCQGANLAKIVKL